MLTNQSIDITTKGHDLRRPVGLVVGDWLVLLLFVFLGQRDHAMNGAGVLTSLVITTLSVALPWTAAAAALGAYRYRAGMGWGVWLGRALNAWLVAAPLGLILRALLKGQGAIAVPFALVMLGLGGLFVLGWRAAAFWWLERSRPVRSSQT